MGRQYLTAKFRPGDTRSYTYHNDGDEVQSGDEILLPSTRGGGQVRGTVQEVIDEETALALPFQTKAIIGRAPPPADEGEPS